ncbi:unnamed protein product [Ambrosiozyma monospora]|nr:unnamed protein product [Ambrosiozyma monospora]
MPMEMANIDQRMLIDTCFFKRFVFEASILFFNTKAHLVLASKLIKMNPLELKVILWRGCYPEKFQGILEHPVTSQVTELECSALQTPFII